MRPDVSEETIDKLDEQVSKIPNLKPEYLTTDQKIQAVCDRLEAVRKKKNTRMR